MNESKYSKKIVKHLNQFDTNFFFKVHQGSKTSQTGLPDIVGIQNGRFVGIESKKYSKTDFPIKPIENHDITPKQEYILRQLKKAGGVAMIAFIIKGNTSTFCYFIEIDKLIHRGGYNSIEQLIYNANDYLNLKYDNKKVRLI